MCDMNIEGDKGLDTLIRAAFLRPAQIVRQFISHSETQKNQGSKRYP